MAQAGKTKFLAARWKKVRALGVWMTRHGLHFRLGRIGRKIMLYLFLIDAAFIFLLPFLYMIKTSVLTPVDLNDPTINWLPSRFNWENYVQAFQALDYLAAAGRTLWVTVIALLGQLFCCSLAGYALARMDFPGRRVVFGAVIALLLLPTQAMIIPSYVFYAKIGWLGTLWPITVPDALGNGLYGALFVFVFRQVFIGFPRELEDAAAIDGAGVITAFTRVVAPLAKPAYATVALFSFVWHWNEYMRPSLFLTESTRTLTYSLGQLLTAYRPGGPVITPMIQAAAIVLLMIPVIFGYAFVQRYFVQGVQLTGIKG